MKNLTPVLFWSAQDVLSNFYPRGLTLEGVVYQTAEHYYQAQKFLDTPNIYEEIVKATTPEEVKTIAKRNKLIARKNWSSIKESIMYKTVYEKFTQNQDLLEVLLNTGSRELIETSPDDNYWGKTTNGGQNRMGIILMQLRRDLREKQISVKFV